MGKHFHGEKVRFAEELGAEVIMPTSRRVADALIDFARREGITSCSASRRVRDLKSYSRIGD